MDSNIITIEYDGQIITGQIILRTKFSLRIRITSPYANWEDGSVIWGQGRAILYHFLTEEGTRTARELLLNIYRKIKFIDENMIAINLVYEKLEQELAEVDKLEDSDLKKRIIKKLNDHFFDDFLLSTSVTGLRTNITEREDIINIIMAYRLLGWRLYMPEGMKVKGNPRPWAEGRCRIDFRSDKKMLILYLTLVIRVSSVDKLYGSLYEFGKEFNIHGVTNGDLLLSYYMSIPNEDCERIISDVLEPNGFKEYRDYVVVVEQYTSGAGKNPDIHENLNEPLKQLKKCDWLDSILSAGNWVWLKD